MLKKHKYFEITLLQVEREYEGISLSCLQEVRCNMAHRYQEATDEDNDNKIVLHVLDEVMENINGWLKKLPLGSDVDSWIYHSPNLMCARQCMNFEREEHAKHRACYENENLENKSLTKV